MRVGDELFTFNENHRVYKRDENGKAFGGPIYREHFRPIYVIGETSKSWIIGHDKTEYFKTPKSNPFSKNLYTKELMEDKILDQSMRYKVVDAVRYSDVETLKKIAAIVGFGKETP